MKKKMPCLFTLTKEEIIRYAGDISGENDPDYKIDKNDKNHIRFKNNLNAVLDWFAFWVSSLKDRKDQWLDYGESNLFKTDKDLFFTAFFFPGFGFGQWLVWQRFANLFPKDVIELDGFPSNFGLPTLKEIKQAKRIPNAKNKLIIYSAGGSLLRRQTTGKNCI